MTKKNLPQGKEGKFSSPVTRLYQSLLHYKPPNMVVRDCLCQQFGLGSAGHSCGCRQRAAHQDSSASLTCLPISKLQGALARMDHLGSTWSQPPTGSALAPSCGGLGVSKSNKEEQIPVPKLCFCHISVSHRQIQEVGKLILPLSGRT